jgi:hypothetical protein
MTAAERIETFGEEALALLAGRALSDGAKLAYVLVYSHDGELPNQHLAMMMGLDENHAACDGVRGRAGSHARCRRAQSFDTTGS